VDAPSGALALRVRWQFEPDGDLKGELEAVNISGFPVRLGGKPVLRPLGRDGVPLETEQVVTLEFRDPPYVVLRPGEHASAPIRWAGWNGPPASDRVQVQWQGGAAEVKVEGPPQPRRTSDPMHLSSFWFNAVP
jgi:hypothetical protein